MNVTKSRSALKLAPTKSQINMLTHDISGKTAQKQRDKLIRLQVKQLCSNMTEVSRKFRGNAWNVKKACV